jgi:hypothetical protein
MNILVESGTLPLDLCRRMNYYSMEDTAHNWCSKMVHRSDRLDGNRVPSMPLTADGGVSE